MSDLDVLRRRFVSRDGAVLVLGSAVQAAGTAGWVAAAELTPAPRRAARVLVLVAAVTAGVLLDVEDDATDTAADADAAAPAEPAAARPGWQRVVLVLLTALAAVASLGGSVLERRWLARLERAGAPRPHRALARRLGAVAFVVALAQGASKAGPGTRRAASSPVTPR